jgi:putative addiction module killer protein
MILKQSATFRKWQRKLRDARAKASIAMRLQRLAAGNAGDAAQVGGGISELRIHYGPGYRIYFQQRGEVLILLLCGGDKITQDRDIGTAKQIAAQWSDNNED